ncbi:MAG: MoaD/ThiS family protein [Thaumarchaeota archaeon]|nr:MoaD/ThiS family protein [Nitrososphaerota archaeon]
MRVKVKFFAMLRELLGRGEEEYELEEGASIRDLLFDHVPKRHGEISSLWLERMERLLKRNGGYILIVNGHRVDLDRKLSNGDVVAVLPPVGGG